MYTVEKIPAHLNEEKEYVPAKFAVTLNGEAVKDEHGQPTVFIVRKAAEREARWYNTLLEAKRDNAKE